MKWLAAIILGTLVAGAQDASIYVQDVVVGAGTGRMDRLTLSDETVVSFEGRYAGLAKTWIQGRSLRLGYDRAKGAVLTDPVKGESIPLLTVTGKHPIEAMLDRCLESPEGFSTQGMVECADNGSKLWDAEIQRLLALLLKAATPLQQLALRNAQQSWQRFFAAEMSAQTAIHTMPEYGTLSRVDNALKAYGLKKDRAESLAQLYAP